MIPVQRPMEPIKPMPRFNSCLHQIWTWRSTSVSHTPHAWPTQAQHALVAQLLELHLVDVVELGARKRVPELGVVGKWCLLLHSGSFSCSQHARAEAEGENGVTTLQQKDSESSRRTAVRSNPRDCYDVEG